VQDTNEHGTKGRYFEKTGDFIPGEFLEQELTDLTTRKMCMTTMEDPHKMRITAKTDEDADVFIFYTFHTERIGGVELHIMGAIVDEDQNLCIMMCKAQTEVIGNEGIHIDIEPLDLIEIDFDRSDREYLLLCMLYTMVRHRGLRSKYPNLIAFTQMEIQERIAKRQFFAIQPLGASVTEIIR
jgi:hypothetical protein